MEEEVAFSLEEEDRLRRDGHLIRGRQVSKSRLVQSACAMWAPRNCRS